VIEVVIVPDDPRIRIRRLLQLREREIVVDVLRKALDLGNDGTTSRDNRKDVPTAQIRAAEKLHLIRPHSKTRRKIVNPTPRVAQFRGLHNSAD
jgi:hypothetical protein